MPTIRENLLRAIELVENEPAHLFDLYRFRKTEPCGTLHCTLGLCATDEFFNKQGITMEANGSVLIDDYQFALLSALPPLFGENAWYRVFAARARGCWDQAWLNPEDGNITDKELALLRLNKQLEEYPE